MEKLNKIDGVMYTQNADLPIEERVFFSEGSVADINDFRVATLEELVEWENFKNGNYQTLQNIKKSKIEEIIVYDSSSAINEFFIQGLSVWLDKTTRVGLKLRFESEKVLGYETTTLWYDNNQITLNLLDAISMLYAIEIYASQCYDNTQLHLSNVSKLGTIEEIESYDYTKGYPEKLNF